MNKNHLVKFIISNDYIKNKISFKEHLKMAKWVMSLSECEIQLLFEEENYVPKVPKVPKPSGMIKKILNMGIVTAAVAIPGGLTLYSAINYLLDDYNYNCALNCDDEEYESLCNRKCKLKSLNYIVMKLGAEYKKCDNTTNPVKCRKRLLSIIKEYRNRRNKVQANLHLAQLKARMKANKV